MRGGIGCWGAGGAESGKKYWWVVCCLCSVQWWLLSRKPNLGEGWTWWTEGRPDRRKEIYRHMDGDINNTVADILCAQVYGIFWHLLVEIPADLGDLQHGWDTTGDRRRSAAELDLVFVCMCRSPDRLGTPCT